MWIQKNTLLSLLLLVSLALNVAFVALGAGQTAGGAWRGPKSAQVLEEAAQEADAEDAAQIRRVLAQYQPKLAQAVMDIRAQRKVAGQLLAENEPDQEALAQELAKLRGHTARAQEISHGMIVEAAPYVPPKERRKLLGRGKH